MSFRVVGTYINCDVQHSPLFLLSHRELCSHRHHVQADAGALCSSGCARLHLRLFLWRHVWRIWRLRRLWLRHVPLQLRFRLWLPVFLRIWVSVHVRISVCQIHKCGLNVHFKLDPK